MDYHHKHQTTEGKELLIEKKENKVIKKMKSVIFKDNIKRNMIIDVVCSIMFEIEKRFRTLRKDHEGLKWHKFYSQTRPLRIFFWFIFIMVIFVQKQPWCRKHPEKHQYTDDCRFLNSSYTDYQDNVYKNGTAIRSFKLPILDPLITDIIDILMITILTIFKPFIRNKTINEQHKYEVRTSNIMILIVYALFIILTVSSWIFEAHLLYQWSNCLKPIYLIVYNAPLRKRVREFTKIIVDSKEIFILMLMYCLVCGCIAYPLFSNYFFGYNYEGFPNFIKACETMFHLLNGRDYSQIQDIQKDEPQVALIIFIPFLAFGNLLLYNMVVAVFYVQFGNILHTKTQLVQNLQIEGFDKLLDKYTELKGKVDLNDVTLDVYNCLCKFHKTQPSHVPIKYLLNNFYNFYRVKKEITFGNNTSLINSRYKKFDYQFYCLSGLSFFVNVLQLQLLDIQHKNEQINFKSITRLQHSLMFLQFSTLLFIIMEFIWQIKNTNSHFWKSFYWIFEALTLLGHFLVVSVAILGINFNTFPNIKITRYFLLVYIFFGTSRVFKFYFILHDKRFERYKFILDSFKKMHKFRMFASQLFDVLLLLFFLYATIGLAWLGGTPVGFHKYKQNFNDFPEAFMTLFWCLIKKAYWKNSKQYEKKEEKPIIHVAIWIYFMSFYVIGSLMAIKLFISFLLQIYKSTYHGQIKDIQNSNIDELKRKLSKIQHVKNFIIDTSLEQEEGSYHKMDVMSEKFRKIEVEKQKGYHEKEVIEVELQHR